MSPVPRIAFRSPASRPHTPLSTQHASAALTDASATPDPGHALRVAIVTEYYYPHLGGICEHVHFFAKELRERGHTVDIITSNLPGAESNDDWAGVIRIGRSQTVYANGSQARITIGIGLRRRMREVLREGRYDIVHVHSPLTPTLPLLAIDEADCPVVGTFHAFFEKQSLAYRVGHEYFARKLDRLDAAIAVSRSAAKAMARHFDAEWTVIPNGVDVEEFRPAAPWPREMPKDVPTVLFLGRLDPRNGLKELIQAFRLVAARREAKLIVVGDGPLRPYYQQLAAANTDIVFVGSVDDRASYYANATLYACPTTRGASFGITLLEAMACETPIVCSDIHGFRNVVRHREQALMVPPGDTVAFADSIVELLDDETLRARLGKAGRETALRYSWPRVTESVLGVYSRILSTRLTRVP